MPCCLCLFCHWYKNMLIVAVDPLFPYTFIVLELCHLQSQNVVGNHLIHSYILFLCCVYVLYVFVLCFVSLCCKMCCVHSVWLLLTWLSCRGRAWTTSTGACVVALWRAWTKGIHRLCRSASTQAARQASTSLTMRTRMNHLRRRYWALARFSPTLAL